MYFLFGSYCHFVVKNDVCNWLLALNMLNCLKDYKRLIHILSWICLGLSRWNYFRNSNTCCLSYTAKTISDNFRSLKAGIFCLRHLKTPRSLSGIFLQTHLGHQKVMVMNDRLTWSLLLNVNQPSHSKDTAISKLHLENAWSRPWCGQSYLKI